MNEIIKNIEEVHDITIKSQNIMNSYDGFKIITDEQEILFLIENEQSCCEIWGYFISNDDVKPFIGATLTDIKIVDEAFNKLKLSEAIEYGLDNGDVVFVDFETDRGVLQLTAYNSQNGCYGHEVLVISDDLNYREML